MIYVARHCRCRVASYFLTRGGEWLVCSLTVNLRNPQLQDVTVDGIWDNGYYDTAILRNHPYDRLTVRQSWIAFCGHGQQPGVSFSEAKRHQQFFHPDRACWTKQKSNVQVMRHGKRIWQVEWLAALTAAEFSDLARTTFMYFKGPNIDTPWYK